MFGTYIRRGEWIVYPFFEYYRDDDLEYKPEEFGYPGEVDYLGATARTKACCSSAYGLGQNLAIEVEAAYISASFEKAADDPSACQRGSRSRAWVTSRARFAGVFNRRASDGRSSSATSRR